MPVRLNVVKNGKYQYIRIFESYVNKDGKPRSRVVHSFGRLDQALAQDPDVLQKAEQFVRDWNEKEQAKRQSEREKHAKAVLDGIRQSPTISYNNAPLLNVGVAVINRLWESLNLTAVFDYLKTKTRIQYDYPEYVRLLTFLRLLTPESKLATWEDRNSTIRDFSCADSLQSVYRCLEKLSSQKENIVRSLNLQISKLYDRDLSAAFYDVTTYAFESQNVDVLRNFGMSKDKKFNEVQVVVGLLMDQNGVPIDYEVHPGNTSEYGTLVPMIKKFKKTYAIKKVTVVADRGLNSNENLLALQELDCDFVIAQKIKNVSTDLESKIKDESNWTSLTVDEDGVVTQKAKMLDVCKPVYETKITPRGRRYQSSRQIGQLDVRWLITYSQKRAHKDQADLDRMVEKATRAIETGTAKPNKKGWKSYVLYDQEAQGTPKLDLQKISKQQSWNGLYGICTNSKDLSAEQIDELYHRLWQIEDCFRVSKSVLDTRPCYVWNPERIRGHFLCCYLALVLEKIMAFQVRCAAQQGKIPYMTPQAMLSSLQQASVVLLGAPSDPCYVKVNADNNFDALCRVFGIEPLCRTEDRISLSSKLHMKKIRTV